ncbi:MAG: hypothetical protein KGL93_07110, partial [Gemmatimonadota bacterium]|nr:hypothetical protein [Gemmatimonadota bacterium]
MAQGHLRRGLGMEVPCTDVGFPVSGLEEPFSVAAEFPPCAAPRPLADEIRRDDLRSFLREHAGLRQRLPHREGHDRDIANGIHTAVLRFEHVAVHGNPPTCVGQPGISCHRRRAMRRHVYQKV